MTRVIVLTTHAERVGGIERSTRTLIQCLTELYGHERVGVMSVWAQSTDQRCVVIYAGRGRDGTGRVGLVARLEFVAAAVLAARRWRRGLVVVACHPHLAPVAWLLRLVAGRPFSVWCHGEEVWGTLRRSVAAALRRADVVFAPSRFTAGRVEETAGLQRGSVHVVPHCLPPEVAGLPTGNAFESRRALTVARLAPEHAYKGVDALIRSWPVVSAAVRGAQLTVVGDGPDRARLETLAGSLGLADQVRFTGALGDEQLAAEYARAAVFALPSRTRLTPRPEGEGFGLVYIEAAAAGLPAVALRGGAIPEVVVDGVTGVLVDSASPQDLGGAIAALLDDPARARSLGQAARRRTADEFGYERFCERISALLETPTRQES